MNVEDLQAIWTEMSEELDKQKKLTHEIIMQMTQQRYKSQLQKISNYEGLGAVLCFIIGIGMLANSECPLMRDTGTRNWQVDAAIDVELGTRNSNYYQDQSASSLRQSASDWIV